VEPDDTLQKTLQRFESDVMEFLEKNNNDISEILYRYVQENFPALLKEK